MPITHPRVDVSHRRINQSGVQWNSLSWGYKLENQWHRENICQKFNRMTGAVSIKREEHWKLKQKLKSNSRGLELTRIIKKYQCKRKKIRR